MPAIAVIMPLYNRATTVRRAIDSVLDQSFEDFELIVVDDGSSDDGAAAVRATGDPRVQLIRFEQNRGANSARNAGIRASTAPLITFLDSDDAYLPDKLATVVALFEARPELDLLVDSFMKLQPSGSPRPAVARTNKVIEDQDEFVQALFTRRLWKATPAITVRRETAVRAGLFDESLPRLQDFDFLVRAAAAGRCAATDKILWLKQWTPDSISEDDRWLRANVELCRRHPQFRTNPAYRPGLAYAVRRSLQRQVTAGRLGPAWSDWRHVAAVFGWREAGALLLEGLRPRPKQES